MKTHWVCVAHIWGSPPTPCNARGHTDTGANNHTQKTPHHPTLTTTHAALADRYAGPTCEQCDRPGELVGHLVLCPKHAEERP